MSKRSGYQLSDITSKRHKLVQQTVAAPTSASSSSVHNPFEEYPVPSLAEQFHKFLVACRTQAMTRGNSENQTKIPVELEIRLGILKVKNSHPERRVFPSGPNEKGPAFDCTGSNVVMHAGVSRRHFSTWTATGKSELNSVTRALNVTKSTDLHKIAEKCYTETVFTYENGQRICFDGLFPEQSQGMGRMESKQKLNSLDLALPAAPYDIRVTLSTEDQVRGDYPSPSDGFRYKRVKRRRSFSRKDGSVAWQIDVTEVTTTSNPSMDGPSETFVEHEIEIELHERFMKLLLKGDNPELALTIAQQAWHVLTQLNPLAEPLDVEEFLQPHKDFNAVKLALAHCGALRLNAEENKRRRVDPSVQYQAYHSPLANEFTGSTDTLVKQGFIGCMPVNFSRHDLEQIQKLPHSSYYCSEKTDGVRHLLVFLNDTAVLIDRAKNGKQPVAIQSSDDSDDDPFASIRDLITPGTVLDGEVVMNRKVMIDGKEIPRPIFIVFDVLSISATASIMHLPFSKRLRHLKQALFRTASANRDMFDEAHIANPRIALPLVRKNFVSRSDIDSNLCNYVTEERGMRIYSNGPAHNHLTDGIIFQPNTPYTCGTDTKLLKWKYLDTVTIDVEVMPPRETDLDETLRAEVAADDYARVDLTRFLSLPTSDRLRLEADKFAGGQKARIAEVGLDPDSGDWYYVTFRPDKTTPNHISTVIGSFLELGEHLTTVEIRYRMSVEEGAEDKFSKDKRVMELQMLEHHHKRMAGYRRLIAESKH